MGTIYDFSAQGLDGRAVALGDYRGKVLLVVNTASKCGFTPQYEGLEELHEALGDRGFEVLGFPCNQFGAQEPGDAQEIATFCKLSYDVQFPLFSKISVKGAGQHPLYKALTEAQPTATGEGPMRERLKGYGKDTGAPAEVLWNFEKFLVGRDGRVAERFAPDVAADDPRLTAAIDRELAKAGCRRRSPPAGPGESRVTPAT